ncbi:MULTISPECIES: MDR family MFS transporter [unclassified Paenibacillus]|uniref:MDR family MFS transporter n=1 Tax=unclassified Paenibacillus TaxID=185978 RepID=UPI0009A88E1A|nr:MULTISPECIES: MDR family MFS transporter [unclassified Paenibacillus]SLJ95318.1 drug resistance transporter, EmrB/QacA subfamily [Paenibacillus sp. RU5A]SOC67360.1 drug resistance transporter, EmrB/QacA subfamily [Paenibacillus sp. RU26A]SOC69220.1 drug resistance transporter, EmrB/QacA subfamily [Paenibacillus sp. RU5M]
MVKSNKLGVILAGLLLAILMASMDNTIVATAIGTIVGDLGGFDKLMWVTSAYMVAEMAGMPIFGKLSDMYGRKRFFIFGIIVFMIGSALCGTADSIIQLSIYRAIQGIGGGALMPIAFTIMFDVVPADKRGKVGGLFGAVFGLSSIFGPLLGAYLTDYIHWSWIFYINLPLGLIAFVMIAFFYKESVEHSKQKIDYFGAFTLVASIVCLMFGLELGGKEYAWNSSMIVGLFAAFAVLMTAFVFIERRVAEPIITFSMFKNRLYSTSNLMAIFSGAAFITASIYIPIYIQGVLGGSATNSGLVLLPMMLGSVVTAAGGGAMLTKLRYRSIMLPTLALLVIGIALLTTLTTDSSRFMVTIFMILVGLGIGSSFSVLSNAAIHGFSARQRGSASSTLNFNRELGMTLGITVFGIVQSHVFASKLVSFFGNSNGSEQGGGVNLSDPSLVLKPDTRADIPAPMLDKITEALSSSIVHTFAWAIIPAVIALLAAWFMSKEKFDPASESDEYLASH